MPKVGFATEVLPVRILDPRPDQILIRAGKRVLQVEQTRDQTRRTGRTPGSRWKEFRPASFEDCPVDQLSQFGPVGANLQVRHDVAYLIVSSCL